MPSCEMFDRSNFHDFYIIKSLFVWASLWLKYSIYILFRGSFRAARYAQCTHQFSHFWNVHFVYPQHTHKEPKKRYTVYNITNRWEFVMTSLSRSGSVLNFCNWHVLTKHTVPKAETKHVFLDHKLFCYLLSMLQ